MLNSELKAMCLYMGFLKSLTWRLLVTTLSVSELVIMPIKHNRVCMYTEMMYWSHLSKKNTSKYPFRSKRGKCVVWLKQFLNFSSKLHESNKRELFRVSWQMMLPVKLLIP